MSWTIEDGATQSLLNGFLLCPERTRLGYVEGLSTASSTNSLEMGSIFHETLDPMYTEVLGLSDKGIEPKEIRKLALKTAYKSLEVREEEARKEAAEKGGFRGIESFELLFGVARALLPGYVKKWMSDFTSKDWVSLESEFCFERGGVRWRGKRDGVYRTRKDQKLRLFETKTKGRINQDDLMDKLQFDLQTNLYMYSIFKEYREWPTGVLYNVVRTPQLRKGKKESLEAFLSRIKKDINERPDHYYMRYDVTVRKSDLLAWRREFDSQIEQLKRWVDGEFHYKNSAACSAYGVTCKFLPVCSRNDLTGFKLKSKPFPELNVVGG